MSIFIPLWYLYGSPVGLAVGLIVVLTLKTWQQSKLGALTALLSFVIIWPIIVALFFGAVISTVFKRGSRRSP